MAKLYADEQFPLKVVQILRNYDHNVLTVQESGNIGFSDAEVLAFAIDNKRTVLTQNRRDYMRLHKLNSNHLGIIICTEDFNFEPLASRINNAIITEDILTGKLIRVNRPS